MLDYNDPKNLCRRSLYEAALLCPSIVMFATLPVGVRIECSPDTLSIVHDGTVATPKAGSFLDLLYRGQRQ